tara:strand:+ start:2457 stop:3644 length:1188 start_codon:yes stop_codon:yes gene_type:complete
VITLKKKFSDIDSFVINKKVILRVDLNLPLYSGEFSDFTRLEKIVPTVNYLLDRKAKIILVSHIGRPDGIKNDDLSLRNLSLKVSTYMKSEVFFLDENINNIKKEKIEKLFKTYNIIMLENLRFFPEEEKNDENFAKKISSFADIYVNECFSVCHRRHSSITSIPKYLPSFPGKLLEKEISNLKKLITISENSSSVAVFGGAKVSSKLKVIEYYVKNFSKIIIGGAMANTFLAALEKNVGSSIYEKSMIKTAQTFLNQFSEKILLPDDAFVMDKSKKIHLRKIDEIKKDEKIYDIGPQTRMQYYNVILECSSLLWNGPLGFYEEKPFHEGTNFVIKAVKNNNNKNFFSVAGGGDTITIINQANASDYFSFISTGGGAFLEFIQGKGLPGLDSLND